MLHAHHSSQVVVVAERGFNGNATSILWPTCIHTTMMMQLFLIGIRVILPPKAEVDADTCIPLRDWGFVRQRVPSCREAEIPARA